jgi:hypothetical protein
MSAIDDVWADGKLPIRNALYFSGDVGSYDASLDPEAPCGLRILDAFDVREMLSEAPDWVTVIDPLTEIRMKDGDFLWAGGTAWGSDGFIARVREDESLVWAVLFQDSNTFEDDIQVSGRCATFRSTADVTITVDIDDPRLPVAPS